MSPKIRKRIYLIYDIAITAVTIIAGICLMIACYGIYRNGVDSGASQIYSRAIVAEAFAPIAVPVYLCLAMVIVGFILNLALPREKKKLIPEKNRQLILERLLAKTDLEQCDEDIRSSIVAQRKSRKLHIIISSALLAVASVIFLVYACYPGRWPDAALVTDAMIPTVLVLIACLAVPTGYIIFTAYHNRASLDKEIALMKQASAQAPVKPEKKQAPEKKLNILLIARYAILVIAVVCVIAGFCNEGFKDVVAKAAAICTECVGLG